MSKHEKRIHRIYPEITLGKIPEDGGVLGDGKTRARIRVDRITFRDDWVTLAEDGYTVTLEPFKVVVRYGGRVVGSMSLPKVCGIYGETWED